MRNLAQHAAPRTRRMPKRAARYAAVAVAAVALGGAAAAAPATAAPGASPHAAGAYAPYNDMSNSSQSLLDTAITQHGVKSFTAAFTIGSGCDQIWGDTLPVGNDPNVDPAIAKAQGEGADVIVSSGGAAGQPLAWTCTDQSKIVAGLQKVVDSYKVSSLDFDIEGGPIADTAAAARQMQAIKTLKGSNPNLKFSVTLPVMPTGLTADGVNILKAAKDAGVKLDVVNIMTMDYGQGNQEMGDAAISAAKATLGQMQGVDSSYTYANLGITPMFGTNDDGSTFTLDDAAKVKSFASSNGVGRLSGWSVNRDQSCGSAAPAGGVTPNASPTCSGVSQSPLGFSDALK